LILLLLLLLLLALMLFRMFSSFLKSGYFLGAMADVSTDTLTLLIGRVTLSVNRVTLPERSLEFGLSDCL
jgi:hypothetical protein